MSTGIQTQLDNLYRRVAAMEQRISSLETSLERGVPSPPGPVRSILDLRDIMAAKERMAQELKDKHSSEVAGGWPIWDSVQHNVEYVKLKREIKEINRTIASM